MPPKRKLPDENRGNLDISAMCKKLIMLQQVHLVLIILYYSFIALQVVVPISTLPNDLMEMVICSVVNLAYGVHLDYSRRSSNNSYLVLVWLSVVGISRRKFGTSLT